MSASGESNQKDTAESERVPSEDDVCLDDSYTVQTNRRSVDALLESSSKEEEPFDLYCFSGREEAVRGWSRVAPLGCMFLPQRKGPKPKNGDQDHHCLLCVDMRPPEAPPSLGTPPEYCCESHVNPQDRGLKYAMPSSLPTSLYNDNPESSPAKGAPECPVPSGQHLANQHLLLRERMAEDIFQNVLQRTPPPLQLNHLSSKYPTPKNRHDDVDLPINGFTVLPPVKSPQLKCQRVNGRSAGGCLEVDAAMRLSARESRGVARTEETRTDAVTYPETSKDTRGTTLTSKCFTCQQNRQWLPTFSLTVPKRCEVPLTTIADSMPRTTHTVGKHFRQASRTDSECNRHTRSVTPQLPILLGTKISIAVSGQRPL